MTLQASGAISFTDIQTEFGDVNPISLSEYYALATGLPSSGAISLNAFYGKKFIVYEIVTSNTTWTPKANLASFINIYVVGAGGSGGHGWPARNTGITDSDGVAGGTGGGAGGVSTSRIAASAAGSSTIVVGAGGAGVNRTSESGGVFGNNGSLSSFVGSGLNMIGNGGKLGRYAAATTFGNDSASAVGGEGGTATGGNLLNLTGGKGGDMSVSSSSVQSSASGGGAPRFSSGDNGDGTDSVTNQASAGRLASGYTSFPAILNTYITGRDQTAILNSTRTTFDASNGLISSGPTGTPVYGAGSGGSGREAATGSGSGGAGVVYIIYEI